MLVSAARSTARRIDRPIEVGWLLRLHGQPDDVIAAGLLDDVREETATTGASSNAGSGP